MAMSATGKPSSSAMIWAKGVSCPWPWVWTPMRAMTLPVGWTRISHESNILMPRMSKVCEGPAPTISVNEEMPMPISSPRARLSAAERAAVGDAAGRLVGVDAVDLDERIGEVVGAGDDVEQAGRELRGVRRRVGVAVVGDGLDLEAGDAAFLRGAQLGVDVVVAGERVRLEVLRAILDPLDGLSGGEAGHHGQDVARIDRHPAPQAAADVA